MKSETQSNVDVALEAVRQTNQDKALRKLEERLRDVPSDSLARYFRALIWSAKQEWNLAIADYEVAIQFSPDDPSLYFNCGLAAWHAEDFTKAEACFMAARSLDPECEGAHYYLALVYERQERLMEALSLAQRALELRPTDCSIGTSEFVMLIDRIEEKTQG